MKGIIYKFISLDENRDRLLALMDKSPIDQPLTEGHVVYNEDVIFKIVEMLKKSVEEALEEPILPQDGGENAVQGLN